MKIKLYTLRYVRPDGTVIKRPWKWAPMHGWNHFYPELIDSPIPITSLDQFYHIMDENDPEIEITAAHRTVGYEYQIPSNKEQREYLQQNKALFARLDPNIYQVFPKRRLLLIGDFHDQCEPLAQQFEFLGWDVVRVATDLEDPPNVDYVLLDEGLERKTRLEFYHGIKMVKLDKIISYSRPDHILVVQNNLELDLNYYREIPVHYYAYRGLWPHMPHNTKFACFFYTYYGAVGQYENAHKYEMNSVKHKEMISYAWNPTQYPPNKSADRPIFFGFMGSWGTNPDPHEVEDMDYFSVKLRFLRNEIVPYAIRCCQLDVQPKKEDPKYVEYMHKVKLALNVSSEIGWTTQRQYHAMGMGCVLVQNYYKGLEQLGFKDRINCLLFHKKYDLDDVLEWAKTHPIELEEIRQAGMKLAQKNTLVPRVKAMMEAMMRYE